MKCIIHIKSKKERTVTDRQANVMVKSGYYMLKTNGSNNVRTNTAKPALRSNMQELQQTVQVRKK